jgi:hypothetical protein
MEVGDKVFILPSHSIAFAGRWGVIASFDPLHLAPFRVQLSKDGSSFSFSQDEFMTEHTYFKYLQGCDKVFSVNRMVERLLDCTDPKRVVTSGGTYTHFSLLLPVTHCRSCNCDTTGLLTDFCESCEYSVPVENK